MEKNQNRVTCLRCEYVWTYSKGIPTYRIKCPRCNSSQNDLNREVFGLWQP